MEKPLKLSRDGQAVMIGTYVEIAAYIHRMHSYSLDHALKYEGYSTTEILSAPPMQHDEHFRTLGATQVYDEKFPREGAYRNFGSYDVTFARYYFNAEGTEIGYVLPRVSDVPTVHPTPRVWGLPHTLVPL